MTTINARIEQEINNIIYYYNRQEQLKKIHKYTESLYEQIDSLNKRAKEIKDKLNLEMTGEFKDVIEFVVKDNHPTTQLARKKVRDGKLERILKYTKEKDEKTAINKYLKDKGVKIHGGETIDINKFLGIKEYDTDD